MYSYNNQTIEVYVSYFNSILQNVFNKIETVRNHIKKVQFEEKLKRFLSITKRNHRINFTYVCPKQSIFLESWANLTTFWFWCKVPYNHKKDSTSQQMECFVPLQNFFITVKKSIEHVQGSMQELFTLVPKIWSRILEILSKGAPLLHHPWVADWP